MNIGEVLSGRAKSNGVRWLLLSPTAQQVLADQVRALLPAGARVGPCRLREARFKAGRRIAAYYDAFVNTESRHEDDVRPIAVTWGANTHEDKHEETVALAKVHAEAVGRGLAAPFRQLMADFSEWTMRVWVSPLDTRFTQLVRFSDPQHVRAVLANTGVAASDRHRTSEYTIRFLKYRPGMRHVLRYDPLDPVDETIFAKLYIVEDWARAYRREDAARAFRVASKAADWLAEHGNNASCLRPLAHVAEDAVVLYPRAVGTPLSDYAQRSVGSVAPWLKRSGEALCSLHQMPAALVDPLGPPHDFAAEIRLIAKKTNHMSTLLPEVGSAIETLLDRARELHARLPQEPPTFTHGDFKSEHTWVAPGRLTLMDFDSAHLADPALDVGYFLADCQFLHPAYDQAGLEQLHESFFAGYAPGVPKERLIRARLYEATGLIKCAVRRVPLFEHDWVSRTAALVGRAQAVLNDRQFALVTPRHTSATTEPEESNEDGSSEPIVQSAVDSALVAPSTDGEPDISALAVALDRDELVRQIGLLPASRWPWGVPQEVRIQVLSCHWEPHCTLEIVLRTQSGCHRLIGKVYATDHQNVYQVMERLRQAGFDPDAEFSIPLPLAYFPSLRLLLQERVEGMSAKEIFEHGDERQCAAVAERSARWLVRFQTVAAPAGRISGIDRFLSSAERKCRLISESDALLASKCEQLLERLRAAAPSFGAVSTCAGHGDYCEHQIIFAAGRTAVVDWDLYDIADPARDVAKFIVSLERLAMRHFGGTRALDGAAAAFLRTYLEAGGDPRVPVALPFYKAVFWLKGRTKAIQTRTPGWRERAEIMLDEGLRSLSGRQASHITPPAP